MISKQLKKEIRQLEHKKHRTAFALFVAEGSKLVVDLMPYFECDTLIATREWIDSNQPQAARIVEATTKEIVEAGLLMNQSDVIALFRQREARFETSVLQDQLVLALDTVQDPGNLGTIIRLCDWFGIRHIVCSQETVDCFNPKTVQATMGALGRVSVHYQSLESFFSSINSIPIYATTLDGDNIYSSSLSSNGIILMGNEGKGVSQELLSYCTKKLFVPSFPVSQPTSESLNVAVATAVVCAEFRRRQLG